MASPLTVKEEQHKHLQHNSPTATTTAITVKCEPQDLPNNASLTPPPETERAAETIAKSVNDLNSFSVAIQAFKARYDELQNHLNFIDKALDARSKELESLPSSNGVVPSEPPQAETLEGTEDEVLSLCQTMCSRGLRRYVISHISEPNLLREKVPAAIRNAPKPAKIVLECIGRFFLQGSKAYMKKDSNMVRAREASVLVLEYYLLSGCVGSESNVVENSVKEEANNGAVAWRKRLIVEGGVAKASEADAKGLILFIACFGIPAVFRNEDLSNLLRLSNAREISHLLRQSQTLLKRVSEIADGIMKKGSVVEAVDLAYTFGFEEKYSPQTALTSFLQKSEEAWKKTKNGSHDIPRLLKEANVKYLAALKSVVSCLEGHKIGLNEFLPGWELKDKISNLEKDISEIKKRIEGKAVAPKRKVDKSNPSKKVKPPEAKRPKFAPKDPSIASTSVAALQEHRIARHLDANSSYDVPLTAHLLDGRSYGYSNNYPATSSLQLGSVSGSLPESYLGGAVASGVNMVGGAIASSAMSAGITATTSSYSGYQGDARLDNVGNNHLYRWRGVGEGVSSDDWSLVQRYAGQPTSAQASADGFAGMPDNRSVAAASRGGGSDLYSFADAVFEL
ncbi:protein FRIGIDA [Arachis stenosperma]|uniref:protein FRIGIDA n=1 Tax=Arachis stenosperma TaxID=217475 RepID=UPI0025AB9A6C|nr:protein FRIGIDA [Arachis stenosperma]